MVMAFQRSTDGQSTLRFVRINQDFLTVAASRIFFAISNGDSVRHVRRVCNITMKASSPIVHCLQAQRSHIMVEWVVAQGNGALQ